MLKVTPIDENLPKIPNNFSGNNIYRCGEKDDTAQVIIIHPNEIGFYHLN